MGKKGTKYTPEFRQQMVDLVRAGRVPNQLAQEFNLSAWTIGHWVRQAARDAGKGDGGLTTAEREELMQLRRENRRLREERDILSKAAAWFANEKPATPKRSSDS
jgi:transposase